MASKLQSESQARLEALRKLLQEGVARTQEDLCLALEKRKFSVTQSTISRDLRRICATKMQSPDGTIVYRFAEEPETVPPQVASTLKGLVNNIQHNGSLIVIQTPPGSASLVARQLDLIKHRGILGTLAGDDTIFVAPVSVKKIRQLVKVILEEFQ